jgi:hypothetical protein
VPLENAVEPICAVGNFLVFLIGLFLLLLLQVGALLVAAFIINFSHMQGR